MRSSGFSLIGVVSVPNTAAPPGVEQISSVLGGNLISNEPWPHTNSKSGLYSAWEIRNAMQAVSGRACSWVSTGGCCACSASGLCSRNPVERASQKFPPKNRLCTSLNWSTGNLGEYVYRCAVRLPARNSSDPGYAIIVRLTDGIGPLKPAYGMWQKPQARFLKGDMFSSKFSILPSICTA